MGSVNRIDDPATDVGYDTDLYAWSLDQAARIRAANVPGLDTDNIAEEIESLGRSDKRELLSRCLVLIIHLLKWKFQPDRRGVSWTLTIREQRRKIDGILGESPSLRGTLPAVVAQAYKDAVEDTAVETGVSTSQFPGRCPWEITSIIAKDWMPPD